MQFLLLRLGALPLFLEVPGVAVLLVGVVEAPLLHTGQSLSSLVHDFVELALHFAQLVQFGLQVLDFAFDVYPFPVPPIQLLLFFADLHFEQLPLSFLFLLLGLESLVFVFEDLHLLGQTVELAFPLALLSLLFFLQILQFGFLAPGLDFQLDQLALSPLGLFFQPEKRFPQLGFFLLGRLYFIFLDPDLLLHFVQRPSLFQTPFGFRLHLPVFLDFAFDFKLLFHQLLFPLFQTFDFPFHPRDLLLQVELGLGLVVHLTQLGHLLLDLLHFAFDVLFELLLAGGFHQNLAFQLVALVDHVADLMSLPAWP